MPTNAGPQGVYQGVSAVKYRNGVGVRGRLPAMRCRALFWRVMPWRPLTEAADAVPPSCQRRGRAFVRG
jgi:hypothetical protein